MAIALLVNLDVRQRVSLTQLKDLFGLFRQHDPHCLLSLRLGCYFDLETPLVHPTLVVQSLLLPSQAGLGLEVLLLLL